MSKIYKSRNNRLRYQDIRDMGLKSNNKKNSIKKLNVAATGAAGIRGITEGLISI